MPSLCWRRHRIIKYGWKALRRFGEVTGLVRVGRQALDAFRTFRGGQAVHYPVGYRPTVFEFDG